MDDERFEPFYAAMAELDRMVRVRPCRNADWPDYPTEPRSRYEIWWTFGWEYDLYLRGVIARFEERLPTSTLRRTGAGRLSGGQPDH